MRDRVAAETGDRPAGPIRMLTNLRYFGHCFNPVTFFFCFDEAGERVEAVLAEVNNTPWGESHAYVIGNRARAESRIVSGRIEKRFPRLTADGHGSRLRVAHDGARRRPAGAHRLATAIETLAFDATLSLERRELVPAVARRMLIRYPAMTAQVVAKIYWQALRLRLKGAPWHPHPERS